MAHVRASTGTRRNVTRRGSTGSTARRFPSAAYSSSASAASRSAAGTASAHARCQAQLMKGDDASVRAKTPSHTSGPSASASTNDMRVTTPTTGSAADNIVATALPSPVRARFCPRARDTPSPSVASRQHAWRHRPGTSLALDHGRPRALETRNMCGIAAIVYRHRGRPVSDTLVRQMCTSMKHRGPDDEGVYVRGAVGLGMRRLSIIDLEGGRQPIFNEDGSKVIVFNGEIYNYRDLRQGLVARGHDVRTHGDTETVLHLYEEAGADCVTPLRGMFAFAIWDESRETLLLGRDRFGIKPLYFA